jgi:hypothetical protein
MKHIHTALHIVFFGIVLLAAPASVHAASHFPESGLLMNFGDILVDKRVPKLRAYLDHFESPLAQHASTFIEEADRNDVDWRLVAAIAGTESTFGKHIPAGSYNAWGWGIPTGAQSGVGFENWKEGIAEVTRGLRKNYMNKGAVTIEQIGRIYAASPAWSSHVRFFIDELDSFVSTDPDFLDVTI